ncbi:MAG: glutathione transferase GstA [Sphingomicrobium sp.]|nr:glutathione transferase GstA [Sphingomonadales bacterium]
MTTLYQAPGACSLAPLIALHAAGLPHDTAKVDLRAHQLADGSDYYAVNPKGAVPALKLDNGDVLTENAVLLQYIADHAPNARLIPASGIDRYRQLELLNYIATEVHKGFGPLFNPATPPDVRSAAVDNLGKKFTFLAKRLDGGGFLCGDRLTAADAYLFTVLRWADLFKIDLSPWPAIVAYRERVGNEPPVKAALDEESLGR